jgi:hypothetical protein
MSDPRFVYRPLLDLIGFTEGTDKGRGYNETLAYGALTGGPVDLVGMTLDQVDALQTRMLAHPDNRWNSSAAGSLSDCAHNTAFDTRHAGLDRQGKV